MNKQLSVMGLAARASMVPVLIASGLTALAVGALTYLANPENTGGAAGVGAAPLAAAVGYLMVMVMLCLGGCGFGSQTAYTVRRLRLREELVDLWWAAYHAAMLLVYSDSFLHHLVPLADAAVWVTDLALLMANALAAALFIRSQRRGRLNLWPLLTVSVTMFTFTVDVADNAWMAMLLTALALMGWMLELLLTGGKNREE